MRVIVTGGSGFIGDNLVVELTQRGFDVINIDVAPPPRARSAHWAKLDVRDTHEVTGTIRRAQATHVVHLAARTDLDGTSVDSYSSNTLGTESVLTAAAEANAERVLIASSRLVCRIGHTPVHDRDYSPTTAYGESKVETERIARGSNWPFEWCIVRPTSIWGPGFGEPYRRFFELVTRGLYVHPRGLRIPKSLGFIDNTIRQLKELLTVDGIDRTTTYLCDSEPTEVLAWAQEIARQSDSRVRSVPPGLLRTISRVGDVVERSPLEYRPPLTSFRYKNIITPMVFDVTQLDNLVGRQSVDLESSVSQTLTWLHRART